MKLSIFQPWSEFVMKGTLPEKLLSDLIELTDTISKDSQNRESRNEYLVGEIDEEWYIDSLSLGNIKFESFLFDMIREYIQVVKFQSKPKDTHLFCSDEVFVNSHAFFKEDSWEILSSWFNNQVDDEYNPIHFHQGVLSGVLYLYRLQTLFYQISFYKSSNHFHYYLQHNHQELSIH